MSATLRVVFMGTPQFAVPSLECLVRGPHRVVAVVTQPDRPAGRGQRLRESPVKTTAAKLDLPILQPATARDKSFAVKLKSYDPDLAVVVAFGQLLPTGVITVPRLGCINAHASLLPRWRGAAPIQHALIHGDRETGVTIMQITQRMDAGDLLSSRTVAIEEEDDAGTLCEKLSCIAADLLSEVLDQMAEGHSRATPQDESLATYAPTLQGADARIDWQLSADAIVRRIRAFRPEPGAFTIHRGLRLKILEAKVTAGNDHEQPPGTIVVTDDGEVKVNCGTGTLVIDKVQPESARSMSAADYLRGRGMQRGLRLGTSSA